MHDPARFHLCCFHRNTLVASDPSATTREITGAQQVCTGVAFNDYAEDPSSD